MDNLLSRLLKVTEEKKQEYHQPLSFYASEESNPIVFHVLNVGEGLMALIIFPNGTTMLYDCNLVKDDKDEILSILKKHIPSRYDTVKQENIQWIDIYVNSHRDLDHYRGLQDIHEKFEIKSIWDSGRTGENTEDADYQYYMRLRRSLIEKYGDNALLVPAPSTSPIKDYGGAQIYCLSSSQEVSEKASLLEKAKIQHTEAIVLSIRYSGRTLFLTSDSDWKSWKEKIIPAFSESGILRTNILIASHHGSRSFFTDEEQNEHIDIDKNPDTTYLEQIDYIDPDIVLISCGDFKQFHHPNAEALAIYKKKASNEQVYTTKEKGHFSGFIDKDGNWTVVPIRFYNRSNSSSLNFSILCQCKFNEDTLIKKSGDLFPIGSYLQFSLKPQGGLTDPYSDIDVWWEVSNGGICDDQDHQEIYYKGNKEKEDKFHFSRMVSYEGTHLLRCRVYNKKKKIGITRIFVVRGYKNEAKI